MFLATLKVSMDLEPEVPTQDRERVMRSLRDKVRQSFNHRVIVRTDDDVSLFMALYDDSFERARERVEDLIELIDTAGEARIELSHAQVFSWFDGNFVETKDRLDLPNDGGRGDEQGAIGGGMSRHTQQDKMIVYNNEDDGDETSQGAASRFNRRQMRIPTRK